ncbi:MAG: hypothetical protein ACHQPH_05285 [Reyranellales bacterium]|jgi:hypothetical protein
MEHGYPLNCVGSLRDIEAIKDKLKEGMSVVIYMSDELEMEAILEFDHRYGLWIGRPIPGTLRYLDGTEPASN